MPQAAGHLPTCLAIAAPPHTHTSCRAAAQEPRTCIFLNCGATLNIRDLVDLGESIRAVVIDSHRPIHHSYNDDEDKMACAVIAKDDYVKKDEIPGSDRMYEHLGELPPGCAAWPAAAHAAAPAGGLQRARGTPRQRLKRLSASPCTPGHQAPPHLPLPPRPPTPPAGSPRPPAPPCRVRQRRGGGGGAAGAGGGGPAGQGSTRRGRRRRGLRRCERPPC